MAKIKVYEGPNLMDIYEQIKKEVPNGKILSTEKIEKPFLLFFKKTYYKVLVEIEDTPAFPSKEKAKQILSLLKDNNQEENKIVTFKATTILDSEPNFESNLEAKTQETLEEKSEGILPLTKSNLEKNSQEDIHSFKVKDHKETEKESENVTSVLEEKLNSMERLLKELVNVIKKSQIETSPKNPFIKPSYNLEELEDLEGDARKLAEFLIERGIEPDIARNLVLVSCGLNIETGKYDLSIPSRKEVILKGIEKYIKFTGPIKVEEGKKKIIAFVGPTGVGKTTNLIKLASYYALDEGKKVAIINADTFKIGAQDQIRIYSRILNVPYKTVSDSLKLKEALKEFHDFDLIFIDTVGRSHYDHWKLGEIKATLSLDESMDIFLVLSCSMKDLELYEATKRFSRLFPIAALFFTKLDECLTPGSIVNVPVRFSYPLSYVSIGQRVPEDVKVLNANILTDIILGEN